MNLQIIHGDCLDVLKRQTTPISCIFADPPDNIGLGYDHYDDRRSDQEYIDMLQEWVYAFTAAAPVVWISFNSKWTFSMGRIFECFQQNPSWEVKACVQVFTFGQHNSQDLGNNHRPLWRLRRTGAPLYPEAIKVPSWRERNGDSRAKPGGRVPGDVFDMQEREWSEVIPFAIDTSDCWPGDVFDFPRVTGNSKQRCDWHPTQLHESLVERALKLTTKAGDHVLDPFGGTGTTMRVCKRIGRSCTLIETSPTYYAKLRDLHPDAA